MESLARTFDAFVASALPPALAAPHQLDILREVLDYYPATLSTTLGFESRLAEAAGQVDVAIRIDGKARNQLAALRAPQAPDRTAGWQYILAFAARWSDPQSKVSERIPHVWLEIDAKRLDKAAGAIPSLFCAVQGLDDLSAAEAIDWISESMVNTALGRPLSADARANAIRCVEALPAHAALWQIGLMPSRHFEGLRLCIRDVEIAEVEPILAHLGLSGAKEALMQSPPGLLGLPSHVFLDLDVGDELGQNVGIECYFRSDRLLEDWPPRSLDRFLDELVNLGLCSDAKRQGLREWQQEDLILQRHHPDLWPTHLQRTASFLGPSYVGALLRGVNHLKLTLADGQIQTAKAYFGIIHEWVTRLDGRIQDKTAGPQS
ncbi:MAG: hypothetical protein GYB68_09940 [Chloroflexi bacterium]|nr:hypothetical protein [Chloroflexota bacterium]